MWVLSLDVRDVDGQICRFNCPRRATLRGTRDKLKSEKARMTIARRKYLDGAILRGMSFYKNPTKSGGAGLRAMVGSW